MIVYKVPVYTYFNNSTTNHPMVAPIFASNFFVNKYKNLTQNTVVINETFTQEEEVKIIDYLRSKLGDYLLIKGIQVYINDPEQYHIIKTVGDFIMADVGFTPMYSNYSATQTNNIPTEVFSVNDRKDLPLQGPTGPCWSIGYINSLSPTSSYELNLLTRATTIRCDVTSSGYFFCNMYVYPENVMSTNIADLPDNDPDNPVIRFDIRARYQSTVDPETLEVNSAWLDSLMVEVVPTGYRELKAAFYGSEKIDGPATQETDGDNPYGNNGVSGMGGGNGHGGDIDSVEGTPIPDLPTITAADLGFITMYNPSRAQLLALSDFMWSGLFDLDTYKKLFSDPMQSIIGLAIVPVAPTTAGNKNVKFGTIDSGVSMPYLSTQYVQFNCGNVSIEDYVGSFLDYSPYTKISIYLPYIGIHEISPDDIMNDTINVTYNIDVLSGACGAFISSAKKGVLYSYNGSCISNIPLTSINFSSAIQNAVSADCSGAAMIAGVVTEAAPLTAAGAIGLLGNGANAALNSKPSVQRSGSLGGSAGVLSVQKPYIIIERPNLSVPANVQRMVGQCSNITAYLGNLSGFTMVEYIHLEGIPATDEEIQEIEALLKEGVIL